MVHQASSSCGENSGGLNVLPAQESLASQIRTDNGIEGATKQLDASNTDVHTHSQTNGQNSFFNGTNVETMCDPVRSCATTAQTQPCHHNGKCFPITEVLKKPIHAQERQMMMSGQSFKLQYQDDHGQSTSGQYRQLIGRAAQGYFGESTPNKLRDSHNAIWPEGLPQDNVGNPELDSICYHKNPSQVTTTEHGLMYGGYRSALYTGRPPHIVQTNPIASCGGRRSIIVSSSYSDPYQVPTRPRTVYGQVYTQYRETALPPSVISRMQDIYSENQYIQ